jgi:hypothetical protein
LTNLGETPSSTPTRILGSLSAEYDATFGRIEPRVESATSLEQVLRRPFDVALEESPYFLRGNSWVTYLPPGVVRRLGGFQAILVASPLLSVHRAGTGAVVRAGATPGGFDQERLRAVFELVRPALPEGEVRRPPRLSELPEPNLVLSDEQN